VEGRTADLRDPARAAGGAAGPLRSTGDATVTGPSGPVAVSGTEWRAWLEPSRPVRVKLGPGAARVATRFPMDSRHDDGARLHSLFSGLRDALAAEIIGQAVLVERLLVALLADGHLLVEGAPGLAKTSAIRALAARIEADFARVQFTPDLLPADLTGTEVW